MRIDDLDTPALVVDLDAFEANVRALFGRLGDRVAVRPHMKTAKSPDVARLLLAAGARGVCVAKLGEAEVMVAGGVDDVLITSELAGSIKVQRLAALVAKYPDARVRVVVDSYEGAAALDDALGGVDVVDALIEVNVGQNRSGVEPGDALALADRLATLSCVRVIGLQGYEGNLQHVRNPGERRQLCEAAMAKLGFAVAALRDGGHVVDVVSTGGTGTAEFCAAHEFVTEVQPGSFVFMDADYEATGGLTYRRALTAIATVISRPADDRVVLDAGLKTLSDDSGHAVVVDAPGWRYENGGDEHGVLTRTAASNGDARDLRLGERVALQPSHIDTTVNLHDMMYAARGDTIEAVWPISARGKVQ